jgi:hypothetical protein
MFHICFHTDSKQAEPFHKSSHHRFCNQKTTSRVPRKTLHYAYSLKVRCHRLQVPGRWVNRGLEWPSPHDCTSSVWDGHSYWTSCSQKGWVKKHLLTLQQSIFFHLVPPLLTQLPHLPTTLLILQWQNLYLFLTKLIILGKIYISSCLNFSNYILF